MRKPLKINILYGDSFDRQSLPMIVETFEAHDHAVSLKHVGTNPEPSDLLDCDVFIDRSPVVDVSFFNNLALRYFQQKAVEKRNVPLMVDNPFATMISLDKRRTHALLSDLIPESYNLDGANNAESIERFADDEYVIIKDPFGWYSNGVERLSPKEALEKYKDAKDLIAQKYIPFSRALGRILTLNYDGNFEILCSYSELPDLWRSGHGATSEYELTEVDDRLYKFARRITKTSGLYLNAIDYVDNEGKLTLFEINAAPNLYSPYYNLGVDSFELFVNHVERSVAKKHDSQ